MSDELEILPCPFCGSPGKISVGGFGELFVTCTNDNCGSGLGGGIWFTDRNRAIEIWNIRAYIPEVINIKVGQI